MLDCHYGRMSSLCLVHLLCEATRQLEPYCIHTEKWCNFEIIIWVTICERIYFVGSQINKWAERLHPCLKHYFLINLVTNSNSGIWPTGRFWWLVTWIRKLFCRLNRCAHGYARDNSFFKKLFKFVDKRACLH